MQRAHRLFRVGVTTPKAIYFRSACLAKRDHGVAAAIELIWAGESSAVGAFTSLHADEVLYLD